MVTVGAQGALTGIGLQQITCPAQTPLLVEIQRLTANGLPDGVTIASGTAIINFNAIATAPAINMGIDERFAFVLSSPVACTLTNAAIIDQYQAGDAYADAGSGWVSLFSSDLRYDVPSFRSLIQPALNVAYMSSGHGGTTATVLGNGKVLVAGNSAGTVAELFDPATNTFSNTGSLAITRQNATATLLGDGRVLLVGGRDSAGGRLASAEIYNPATGTFTPTGNMIDAREGHRAVRFHHNSSSASLLRAPNVAGSTFAAAEIYDVSAGTFSSIGNMLLAPPVPHRDAPHQQQDPDYQRLHERVGSVRGSLRSRHRRVHADGGQHDCRRPRPWHGHAAQRRPRPRRRRPEQVMSARKGRDLRPRLPRRHSRPQGRRRPADTTRRQRC